MASVTAVVAVGGTAWPHEESLPARGGLKAHEVEQRSARDPNVELQHCTPTRKRREWRHRGPVLGGALVRPDLLTRRRLSTLPGNGHIRVQEPRLTGRLHQLSAESMTTSPNLVNLASARCATAHTTAMSWFDHVDSRATDSGHHALAHSPGHRALARSPGHRALARSSGHCARLESAPATHRHGGGQDGQERHSSVVRLGNPTRSHPDMSAVGVIEPELRGGFRSRARWRRAVPRRRCRTTPR